MSDVVVSMKPRTQSGPNGRVAMKPWTATRVCEHRQSLIDKQARTLECGSCGVSMDPIEVLWTIALEADRDKHNEKRDTKARDYLEWIIKVDGLLKVSRKATTLSVRPTGMSKTFTATTSAGGGPIEQIINVSDRVSDQIQEASKFVTGSTT